MFIVVDGSGEFLYHTLAESAERARDLAELFKTGDWQVGDGYTWRQFYKQGHRVARLKVKVKDHVRET